MNNQEVSEYLKDVKPHENCTGNQYVCDILVKEGYGQTCGGYLKKSKIKPQEAEPSQLVHFINYYGDRERNMKAPSYSSLHCPQLLLWIAEVAGIDTDKLQSAKNVIINYEEQNNLKGNTNKGGSYLPEAIKQEFKKELEIVKVNKIIAEARNWEEVHVKVSELK